MGVDWDKQTRDPVTGRWVNDDSKILELHIRLNESEREIIMAEARRQGISMSQVVLDAVRAQARTGEDFRPPPEAIGKTATG